MPYRIYDLEGAARYLGEEPARLAQACEDGRLRGFLVGGVLRFLEADLDRYRNGLPPLPPPSHPAFEEPTFTDEKTWQEALELAGGVIAAEKGENVGKENEK